MSKAVTDLQNGLAKGLSKIDVGTAIGKSLTKNIDQFQSEFAKFSQLTKGGTSVKAGNSKEAIQSGEKLLKVYQDIQAQISSLGGTSTANLKKLFPDSFDGRIDEVRGKLSSLQNQMLAIGEKELRLEEARKSADGFGAEIDSLKASLVDVTQKTQELAQANQALENSKADLDTQEQSLEEIKAQTELTKQAFVELRQEFVNKINLNSEDLLKELDQVEKEIDELKKKKEELTKSGDIKGAGAIGKELDAKTSKQASLKRQHSTLVSASAKAASAKDASKLMELAKYAGDAKQQNRSLKQAQALVAQQAEQTTKLAEAEKRVGEAKEANTIATQIQKNAQEALNSANESNDKVQKQIDSTTKKYEDQRAKVEQLETEITNMRTKLSTAGLAKLKEIIPGFDESKLKTTQGIQDIVAELDKLDNEDAAAVRAELEKLGQTSEEVEIQISGMKNGFHEAAEGAKELSRAEQDMENLKNQVLQFFSITNSIQLFKRAVTSAMNTIKELDATMTEAAVVTEFDIGDMWDNLPEYSKNAQALGVSINGMYQATTLYYQQGLKSNEAMELGIETMKMAKIAGIDSAEATKAMTAALRGFNMELNEMSATRVNDVYSQLAAVTAADTAQISTAMEKTASIAASANMEFETTAALLAQIIETTQEAPETAGTAMKTIIARFAEVKSLREQGLISGEDEEGEIIDVNKIQTALRSVGISMEGFFSGTEGLDSVLLKLAEKWGSLDFETQRYIATMAAGSRQQSRFIAMMSDYKRTTELVGEAQNSAGASQKQFQKTQESLGSSLTKLKNAWDQFLMGLANNEIIKGAVDMLTMLLTAVNKVTQFISGDNGLLKSIVSLVMVIGTLKAGSMGINKIFDTSGVMGLVSPKDKTQKNGQKDGRLYGESAAKAANKAFQKNVNLTSRNNPKKSRENKEKTVPDSKPIEESTKAQGDFNKEAQKTSKIMAVSQEQIQGAQEAMGKLSNGMFVAGGACMALSGLFAALGLDEAAEAAATLGTIFVGIGGAISLVSSLLPIMNAGMAAMGAIGAASGAMTAASWTEAGKAIWAALAPVLPILLAITAVIIGIIALFAAIKWLIDNYNANTLEGRMAAAAEATERAKKAAEEASQAYNDLLTAKNSYEDLQTQIDELTKGTLEWKKALIESNQQVLKLLETYPELAGYLSKGEFGNLEIADEGWEFIQDKQLENIENTSSAVVVSQMKEIRLENEGEAKADKEYEFLRDDAYFVDIITKYQDENGIQLDKLNTEALDKIIAKYNEMGDAMFDEENRPELQEFAEELSLTVDQIEWLEESLRSYSDAIIKDSENLELAENNLKLKTLAETALSNSVSSDVLTSKYGNDIISGIANGLVKNQEREESKIIDDLAEKTEGQLIAMYSQLTGKQEKDVPDELKDNLDALKEEITKIQVVNNYEDKTEQIYASMEKLNEEQQGLYAALMSRDISKAGLDFSEQIQNLDYSQMATKLGFGSIGEMSDYFGFANFNDMKETFEQLGEYADAEFRNAKAQAERNKVATSGNVLKKASVEQFKTYVNLMSQAMTTGGKEELSIGFKKIFKEATEAGKEELVLDMINSFDWKREGSGEEFIEQLKAMLPELDMNTETMKNFVDSLKDVNAIFNDFDTAKILNDMKSGFEQASKIAQQDSLSNDEFVQFVEEGLIENIDEWSWDGTGWVNITNGMDDLVDAIERNTLAQFNQTKEEAQTAIDWYDNINKSVSEGKLYVDQYGNMTLTPDLPKSPKKMQGQQVIDDVIASQWKKSDTSLESYLSTGTAQDSIWQRYFKTRDEYDKWVEAYKNGGMVEAQRVIDITSKVDPTTYAEQFSKDTEKYDQYYNEYEVLTNLARKRERLEKDRNNLLEKGNAIEAKNNRQSQIKTLTDELATQEAIKQGKMSEINTLLNSKNSIFSRAGLSFNEEDGTINFNVSEVNKMGSSERENFDKALEELVSLRDQWRDADDLVFDITLDIKDLEKEDRSSYIDFATQVKDALVNQRKEEIDKLKAIDDSINDTNSQILESMQRQIDETRQARDNAKTEQELADKERRLAYLQQDTSGANAAEILKLQKEIEEGQESYTDQLIDQKISELQQQNDEAAEQRARQIEILEAQLEADERNGKFWEDVQKLLTQANTTGLDNSELAKLLQDAAGYSSMSDEEKEAFWEELRTNFGNAYTYKSTNYGAGGSGSGGGSTGDTAGGNTGNTGGNTGGNTVGNSSGSKYSKYTTMGSEELKERLKNLPVPIKEGDTGESVAIIQAILNHIPYTGDEIEVDGIYGDKTKEKLAEAIAANETMWNDIDGGVFGYYDKELLLDNFPKFKTGGLADFTGPAWLDGTKSNPEYVLNAGQTKAFFTLVDVLSSLKSNSGIAQNIGESSYDIDINVESIGSDYDVERMAEKIKTLIVDATRYRNNNTL